MNTEGQENTGTGNQGELRAELDMLDQEIADLKTEYELFFSGMLAHPPDKLHQAVQRKIRELERSPFKATSLQYRLRGLRARYNTYNSYIQRVLREREAGTYHRDVQKAELRAQARFAEERAQTEVGAAEERMRDLFRTYRNALKTVNGSTELTFEKFRDTLLRQSRENKSRTGAKKVSFAVVEDGGRVTVKVKARA